MSSINSQLMKTFVRQVGEKLAGDWIVIGGTVLPLVGIDHRVTLDIDLVGKSEQEQSQALEIMTIAESLNLPIEAINQAGAYFLHKVPYFEKDLILFHKGKRGTIYRPNLYLYLKLKLPRFSESDQSDCLAYCEFSRKDESDVQIKKASKYIAQELKKTSDRNRIAVYKKFLSRMQRS